MESNNCGNGVAFGHRKALTDIKYIKAHIVGDALEDGCSLRMTWAFLAEHSREEVKEPFSILSVFTLSKVLKPFITRVSTVSQGSNIATSAWA